jgi:hypothetical protein
MEFLTELWLLILVSAVFVFLASSVIHMMLPIHKKDYGQMPAEDSVLEAMRGGGLPRGQYMFPFACSFKDFQEPEHVEKLNKGPVGFMTVLPNGPMNMGKQLTSWFIYCIVASVFVAYLADLALPAGADYMAVFRITGTVGFLAYGLGAVIDSIWKGQPWSTSLKFVFDGLVYALVTAGAFGWLWPAGA